MNKRLKNIRNKDAEEAYEKPRMEKIKWAELDKELGAAATTGCCGCGCGCGCGGY
jgi:hypothetical protein